jgi:hypothetical protein
LAQIRQNFLSYLQGRHVAARTDCACDPDCKIPTPGSNLSNTLAFFEFEHFEDGIWLLPGITIGVFD